MVMVKVKVKGLGKIFRSMNDFSFVCHSTSSILTWLHPDLIHRTSMTPIDVWGCFFSLLVVGKANSPCKYVSCSAASRWWRVLQVSTIYSPVFLFPRFPVQWGVLNYKQLVCFCFMHITSWVFIPPLQRSGWYIVFALSVRACVRACVRASEQFPEHISHVFSHIVMKLSIRVLVWKAVCHVP